MIPQLLAIFADLLTSGALAYCPDHEGAYPSRPMSAAAILEREEIRPTGTPGCYRVRSAQNSSVWYLVTVDDSELTCQCEDYHNRAPHVCRHAVAAAMYRAIQLVETPTINTEALADALA